MTCGPGGRCHATGVTRDLPPGGTVARVRHLLALLALFACGCGASATTAAGSTSTAAAAGARAETANCRPGAEPSRSYGKRPPERQLRYGSRPTVIGCVRLPQAGQIELVGYQLGARRTALCIDQVEPGGSSYGCGSNSVFGGGAIDATGLIGRTRIEGATIGDVASVVVRYELGGLVKETDASLVRVRNRGLLRRLRVAEPFGHYLAEVPPDARAVQVEARDARGQGMGVANNANFGQPVGEGRRCLSRPTITSLRVLGRPRAGRGVLLRVRVDYPNGNVAGIRVNRRRRLALIAHPPAREDGAAGSSVTVTLPVQLGKAGRAPFDVIADGVPQDATCPVGIRRSAPRTVSVRIR